MPSNALLKEWIHPVELWHRNSQGRPVTIPIIIIIIVVVIVTTTTLVVVVVVVIVIVVVRVVVRVIMNMKAVLTVMITAVTGSS